MEITSHPVKGADSGGCAICGKVDIKGGGIQGFMAEESFDGEQIRAIFVQVGAERMAKRVAGKPSWPSKAVFMGMDVPGKEPGVNRPVLSVLLWEKIAQRFSAGKPVLCQDVQSGL